MMPRKMALAMLLAANALGAWADNRLHIEDFQVLSGGEIEVSVLMENDANVGGIQTNLNLPAGMTLVDIEQRPGDKNSLVTFMLNPDRIDGHQLSQAAFGGSSYKIIVASKGINVKPFRGQSGEIFKFKVKAGEAMADNSILTLTDQVFSTVDYKKIKPANDTAQVTKLNPADLPQQATLTSNETSFDINPLVDTHTLTFSLAHNFDVKGMSAMVKLPKGMTISDFAATNRLDGFDFDVALIDEEQNLYYLMAASSSGNTFWKEEGLVFTLDVQADTALAENDQIVISDVELTNQKAQAVLIDGLTINVTNANKVAKHAADDAVAKALKDLADARATVNPEVAAEPKVIAADAAAQAAFDALKNKIGDAYDAGSLALTDYAPEIAEAAAKAAALTKTAAEEKALKDETAVLKKLNDDEKAAEDAVPAEIRDNKNVIAAEQAAKAAVQALQDAVDAAYADGELASFDNAALKKAAEDAIAEIGKVAAEQKKIYDNSKRYQELRNELDRLNQALRDQKDTIATADHDVADQFGDRANAIQNLLDQGRTNLDADDRATALTPESDLRPSTVKQIEDLIAQLRADADAAEAAFKAEQAAEQAAQADADEVTAQANALVAPENDIDNKFFNEANKAIADANDSIAAAKQAAKDFADAVAASKQAGTALADSAEFAALKEAADKAIAAAEQAIAAAKDELKAAKAANEAENKAAADAKADVVQEQIAASALEAPENDIDNKFYDDANQAIADAEQAIADANAAVATLDSLVNADVADLNVLADSDAIQAAGAAADAAIKNAEDAIKAAEDALEAAKAAEAGELAAEAVALGLLDDLDNMVKGLVVPEKVDNPYFKEANDLVDVAQAAKEAAEAAAAKGDSLVKAKIADMSVLADTAELIAAAQDALAAVKAAEAAIKAAEDALAAAEQSVAAANAATNKELADSLKALKKKLDDTWADIRRNDGDVEQQLQKEYNDIDRDITDERESLKELSDKLALADAATVDSLKKIYDAIDKAIDALKAKADRMQENETAKVRLDGELNDMEKKLDEAQKLLDTDYADVAASYADRMKQLRGEKDSLQDYVDSLYADTLLTKDTQIDTKTLSLAIDKLLDDAKNEHTTVGIAGTRMNAKQGEQYFTLGGKRVSAPVRGQMMIVKYADGTMKKVMVK